MNSAEYVADLIARQKAAGTDPQTIAWNAALACVGWPYVFGARGQYCTPANRRARYSDEHPTIKTKCKNYSGTGSCSGCQWLPGGQKVRFFDCRGFTYWILKQVYGWELGGAGATSQWTMASNWKAKGSIAEGIPKDTLVCLFVQKGKTMEHTGFGLNSETVECSSGVQHYTNRMAKWTHWAVPAVIGSEIPQLEPAPVTKPTLRRGSSGEQVMYAQMLLINRGYSCGSCGADGKLGKDTEAAVIRFQKASGLTPDGIVGAKTWAALEQAADKAVTFTVTVTGLSASAADEIISRYGGEKAAEN